LSTIALGLISTARMSLIGLEVSELDERRADAPRDDDPIHRRVVLIEIDLAAA
jgi:hypothetical protein